MLLLRSSAPLPRAPLLLATVHHRHPLPLPLSLALPLHRCTPTTMPSLPLRSMHSAPSYTAPQTLTRTLLPTSFFKCDRGLRQGLGQVLGLGLWSRRGLGLRSFATQVREGFESIRMPAIMTAKEGSLDKWLVKEGADVAAGQSLCEVTLGDLTVSVDAPLAGVVAEIFLPQVVARILNLPPAHTLNPTPKPTPHHTICP